MTAAQTFKKARREFGNEITGGVEFKFSPRLISGMVIPVQTGSNLKMVDAGGVESGRPFTVVRDALNSLAIMHAQFTTLGTIMHHNENILSRLVPSAPPGGGMQIVDGWRKRNRFIRAQK